MSTPKDETEYTDLSPKKPDFYFTSPDSNDEEEKLAIQALNAPFLQSNKLVKVLAIDVKKEKLARRQGKQTLSTKDHKDSCQTGTELLHLPSKHNGIMASSFPWINMYPDHPNPKPGIPMCICSSKYYSAPEVLITDKVIVQNMGNYRVALANYGVTTGTFYYEAKVLELPSEANLRIGIAQTNVKKQAPLGFDGFGYSFRANLPTIFHRSRPYDVGVSAQEGDTIGVLIHLPPLSALEEQEVKFRVWNKKYVYSQFSYEQNINLPSILHPLKVPCGERGQSLASPIPFPPQLPYPHPDPHRRFDQFPLLSGSQLVFFVNGQQVGTPFSNLILAKYYPAISLFRSAKVEFNFGPNFAFPPPPHWHPQDPTNPEKYGFLPVLQNVLPFSVLATPDSPTTS